MRYLLLLLIAYFVFKSVGKMLNNLKVMDDNTGEVRGQSDETQNHLRIDESDIEDADFKEVDETDKR